MNIIWSEKAQITFDSIVLYIEVTFGVNTTKKFIAKVDSIINTIASQPHIYKSSNFNEKVRKATINKQCSMFYEINNESIHISYFWNNRAEPMFI